MAPPRGGSCIKGEHSARTPVVTFDLPWHVSGGIEIKSGVHMPSTVTGAWQTRDEKRFTFSSVMPTSGWKLLPSRFTPRNTVLRTRFPRFLHPISRAWPQDRYAHLARADFCILFYKIQCIGDHTAQAHLMRCASLTSLKYLKFSKNCIKETEKAQNNGHN